MALLPMIWESFARERATQDRRRSEVQDAAANDGEGQGGWSVGRLIVADRVVDEIQGGAVFVQDAPAPLLPPRAPGLVHDLARREADQEPPEVVAVIEPGKTAPRRPGAEALEGAQRGVLLVSSGAMPPGGAKAGAG